MKVRCLFTALDDISDPNMLQHVRRYVHLSEIGLVRDAVYEVYGISFRDDVPWYCLCDEPGASYPIPCCAAFFAVVCSTVPPDWVRVAEPELALVPRAWVEFPCFLESLVDGNPEAATVFANLKLDALGRDRAYRGLHQPAGVTTIQSHE